MFEAKYESIYIEEKLVKEIDKFWEYFILEEENIISALYNKNKNYLMNFEKRLENVFYRYNKKLRYIFKKENDSFYFIFFYGRNSYLMTVGNELLFGSKKKLKNNWVFELKKWRFIYIDKETI